MHIGSTVYMHMGVHIHKYGCRDVYRIYRHGLGAWAAVRADASLGNP